MIDENKIEDIAKYYAEENSMSIEDQMGDTYDGIEELSDAYKAGAKWAINEFIKSLWHPAGEEPRNLKYIVFTTTIFGEVYLFTKQVDNKQDWKAIVECHGIEQWVYRDDIVSLIFKEVKRK